MRHIVPVSLVIASLLGIVPNNYADRAALPFLPNAKLSVPRQQAIVGWKGRREPL